MRLKFRSKIDIGELERLIDRYYEGLTTVEEEKQLYKLLTHPDVKNGYEAERAMLGYFRQKNTRPQLISIPVLRKVAVVAIVVMSGIAALQLLTPDMNATSYAYVNGIRITDPGRVKTYAKVSLGSLTNSEDLLTKSLEDVSSRQMIENQLDIFAETE